MPDPAKRPRSATFYDSCFYLVIEEPVSGMEDHGLVLFTGRGGIHHPALAQQAQSHHSHARLPKPPPTAFARSGQRLAQVHGQVAGKTQPGPVGLAAKTKCELVARHLDQRTKRKLSIVLTVPSIKQKSGLRTVPIEPNCIRIQPLCGSGSTQEKIG